MTARRSSRRRSTYSSTARTKATRSPSPARCRPASRHRATTRTPASSRWRPGVARRLSDRAAPGGLQQHAPHAFHAEPRHPGVGQRRHRRSNFATMHMHVVIPPPNTPPVLDLDPNNSTTTGATISPGLPRASRRCQSPSWTSTFGSPTSTISTSPWPRSRSPTRRPATI